MSNLRRQLELARFERGMEVAESLAAHRALLTTAELARMNAILIGVDPAAELDPWRRDPVTVPLPGGKEAQVALIAEPVLTAREKLHRATALAENGQALDAAVDIYVGLVMAHVFRDANRRTATLAAHYFFRRYDQPLSGLSLHELGLGDLREAGQIDALHETVRQMARFAGRR